MKVSPFRTQCALVSLLLAGALHACDAPRVGRPAIGTVVGYSLNDAVRLAVTDDSVQYGSAVADTVLNGEPNSRAATSIAVATQLVAQPRVVAVIGHMNSGSSLAAAQTYNDAAVVQMAPTSTAELYGKSGAFSFRMVPSDAEQGPALAQAIARGFARGTRVAVMYVNDDYGRGLRSSFRRALDTLAYPLVAELPHLDGQERGTSVNADVAPVAAARPQVIVWIGRPTTLHAVLPSIRRDLGDVTVLGSDATTAWTVRGNADGVLTGVQYVDFLDLDATPELRAFADRFAARFGYRPGAAEVLTYDAARLLLRAIRDGAASGEALRQWLDGLGRKRPAFVGVSGRVTFTADGDVQRPLVLRTIPAPADSLRAGASAGRVP